MLQEMAEFSLTVGKSSSLLSSFLPTGARAKGTRERAEGEPDLSFLPLRRLLARAERKNNRDPASGEQPWNRSAFILIRRMKAFHGCCSRTCSIPSHVEQVLESLASCHFPFPTLGKNKENKNPMLVEMKRQSKRVFQWEERKCDEM